MKAKSILSYLLALLLLCRHPGFYPAAAADTYILPILMYHEVRETNPGKDSVYPWELEADLRFLRDEGYTVISPEMLLNYVFSGSPLPEKPVLLSFDDGCGSFPVYALPLLQRYGAPVLLSVIGESTDEFSAYPQTGRVYAHMSWQQLRQVLESGLVEPGNHSYALHRLEGGTKGCLPRSGESPEDYKARLTADARRLQERLLAETGEAAAVFTYPYGFYDEQSDAILAETGFRATLTCDFGLNRISRDPACLLGLRRICRSHGADLASLLEEAAHFSGLDPEPEKEKETWNLTACWTTARPWKPTMSAAGFTNITNGTKQPVRIS